MARKDWVWLGKPAHFIAAQRCVFRLATYIPSSNVIVSTVGEMRDQNGQGPVHPIGFDRTYETYVFKAVKAVDCPGCPYHIIPTVIDCLPANSADDAFSNHYALAEKFDTKRKK